MNMKFNALESTIRDLEDRIKKKSRKISSLDEEVLDPKKLIKPPPELLVVCV